MITATLIKVDPIWQPLNQQAIYRALLTAMSFPGRVIDIGELLEGARAELGALASLVDEMATIADPDGRLTDAERRLLSAAAIASAADADYVLFDGANAPPENYKPRLGTIYRPEEASLIFLAVAAVGEGEILVTLTGPGVKTEKTLALSGLHPDWVTARNRWCDNFPTGIDLIFCDAMRLAAIPRTSKASA